MCAPAIPIIATVMTVGSQVAGAIGEAKAQDANHEEAVRTALANLADNYRNLNARGTEEQKSTARDIEQAGRQTTAATSTAMTSAGESGVGGLSVKALANDNARGLADYTDAARQGLELTLAQLQRQKESAKIGAANTINAHPRSNPLNTAIKIAGAVGGGLSSIASLSAPSSSTAATVPDELPEVPKVPREIGFSI
ncbi:MAG TPA: hypothetical protein VM537_08490 [Anaerolineae bacterium]|nr:hypothetical protein [Anaerolineae bacterium]